MCLSKPPKMPETKLPAALAPPPEAKAVDFRIGDEEDSHSRLSSRHKGRNKLRIDRTPANAGATFRA